VNAPFFLATLGSPEGRGSINQRSRDSHADKRVERIQSGLATLPSSAGMPPVRPSRRRPIRH
jgi:hypothetical protein